jgi:hypothetical protein
MKKNSILISVLSVCLFSAQQTDPINKIYPPAPTANNLMKFEEIPVSLYTGVPEISIPIYNLTSARIEIPVSLNYHALSAKPDEFSTEVGLGWNLIAGGTITRTVKGLPDEAIKDNLGSKQSIGLYIDEYSNHPNFMGSYRNYTAKYLDIISNNGLPDNDSNFRKFGFESAVLNRYDTQYDLYQYNFLGYTGRFIIKKNSNNSFQVVKLDKNNLKITSIHNSLYEPISFIIVDESGKKYTFDITEKTKRTSFVDKTSQFNSTPQSTVGQIDEYNSSFHISSIKDNNDENLVIFEYNPSQDVNLSATTVMKNFPVYSQNYENLILTQIDSYLPPKSQSYTTNTSNKVRTLKRINVVGGGILDFIYTTGREDTGFSALPYKLSEMQIKDNSERIIKKFLLTQGYSTHTLISEIPKKRMILNELICKNISDTQISKHTFDYYHHMNELTKDPWGYFKCYMTNSQIRAKYGNNGCSDNDVLKTITYPTGGRSEFIYETNTFSYMPIGVQQPLPPITDFSENPDNWIDENEGISYNKFKESEKYFFRINAAQDVTFNYNFSSIPNTDWRLELLKGDGTLINYTPEYIIGTLYNNITSDLGSVKIHMEPGYYYARLDTDDANMMFQTFGSVFINALSSNYDNQNEKYLYGGGIRIKDIKYTDNNIVVKQKSYNYNEINDPLKSSGSLVFPYPVINYLDGFTTKLWYQITDTYYTYINYNNTYQTTSTENALPVLKTKGGDIGYENVSVFESDKGKITNYYKSPRLFSNTETASTTPPFLPITDEDFKRGYLTKEEIKDQNNILLVEKSLDYLTQTYNIYTGILFRQSSQNPYLSEFETYDDFLSYKQNCGVTTDNIKCGKIEDATIFPINYSIEKSILARVNNTSTDTKTFFNNSLTNYTLENSSTVYNVLDLPVQKTTTSPDSIIAETTYQYAHDKGNQLMISKNMIGIPLETTTTQTISGVTKTLGKSETIYPTSLPTTQTGSLVLPLSQKSYDKLDNTLSTDVTYDKYDEKGNLLQYTTKDGISTTIIWGYNKTQPIAKITGAKLSYIQQSLINAIVTASDTDAAALPNNDETTFLTALDNFRKDGNLSNYQITTYTYDPLIGVRSITPPSGIREVYLYDTARRLMEIREDNQTGRLIKEFKYNYKN